MINEESSRELSALALVVLGQDDLSSALTEIARIAVRTLPDCDGASMTMLEEGVPAVVAADGPWATALDELQHVEREGPCLDGTRTGVVFRVRDLAVEARWPFYSPRAAALGARSMVSLPMAAEGKIVGALNVYSREPDAFDAETVALGEMMAAQAGVATQVAASFFRHRDLAEQLREAMQSRAVIEQAKGVLMATRRCDADTAFATLVELSQTSNRKLRDLAAAVVAEAASG
ncbi:MAG: histidine kinase [Frankiales bacterium]|nr:histidine kinase [Frankiales bacterium]